eukprot:2209950-Pyramimonas_sp.AAC.1
MTTFRKKYNTSSHHLKKDKNGGNTNEAAAPRRLTRSLTTTLPNTLAETDLLLLTTPVGGGALKPPFRLHHRQRRLQRLHVEEVLVLDVEVPRAQHAVFTPGHHTRVVHAQGHHPDGGCHAGGASHGRHAPARDGAVVPPGYHPPQPQVQRQRVDAVCVPARTPQRLPRPAQVEGVERPVSASAAEEVVLHLC